MIPRNRKHKDNHSDKDKALKTLIKKWILKPRRRPIQTFILILQSETHKVIPAEQVTDSDACVYMN